MGETYTTSASFVLNAIRTVFSTLDRPAYWLLEMVYQLFFNVASADIFANGMVMKFYGRVQMILSVFMMFQLALIIMKGIINPDSFYDKKSGIGSFVTRVVVALVLLVLMVPIKTGGQNEFDNQVASNGLLFGTLYSLQHRILANNTIGRLVMGSSTTDYMSDSSDTEDLKKASRIFASTVLRGFYRINLLPESDRPKHEDGKDDAVFNDNRMCQDIDDSILDAYTKIDADPGDIIGMVNETCEPNLSFNILSSGNKKYAFTFMPVISTIAGFLFAFILLSFTVDIAVRAVKLAVLRLIAPVPIIAYMNPKGSTDNAFNAWVKTLVSTYLDLFIRLASVYFVIAIIQEMITNGIYINHGDGIIGILSLILIWFGLFIFAKQAPKFIKDVLGLKEGPGKLFGGFGEIMSVGAAGLGTIGSAVANYRAAHEENEALHTGQIDKNFNWLRNIGSAAAGAIGGGYVGAKALMGKDASAKSVLAAQSQRNANRAAHSTVPGRIGGDIYGMFAGRSLATRDQGKFEGAGKAFDELKKLKTVAEEEALKQKNYYGTYKGNRYNYQALQAQLNAARAAGHATFTYTDDAGNSSLVTVAEMDENVMNDIKSTQAESFLADQRAGLGAENPVTHVRANFSRNGTLMNQVANADRAVREAGFDSAGGRDDNGQPYDAYDGTYSSIKKTMGRAADTKTKFNTNMKYIRNRANSQGKK